MERNVQECNGIFSLLSTVIFIRADLTTVPSCASGLNPINVPAQQSCLVQSVKTVVKNGLQTWLQSENPIILCGLDKSV